jgi:Ni/Co efflux regulator RcnB
MKRTLLAIAITALALSGPAFAGKDGKDGKGNGKKGHGGHDRVEHVVRGHAPAMSGRHDNGLHLGHHKRAWARGERLPTAYLAPRYYVDDYRAYQLAPPPRGTVWVQPYEDSRRFYLVQVATGLITQILGR